MQSQRAHGSGKYYFEVIVEHGTINRNIEADIQLRVSNGRRYVETLYNIRPQERVLRDNETDSNPLTGSTLSEIRSSQMVIGVAADLDAGQFYRHRNGDWRGVPPGSGRGAHIPPGQSYTAEVVSSVANLSFSLNGVVLQTPVTYRGDSGCFELQDVSRGIAGLASGAGYWVVLKPLDVGNHELRFGGMFRADGFTQDIRYRIQVQ